MRERVTCYIPPKLLFDSKEYVKKHNSSITNIIREELYKTIENAGIKLEPSLKTKEKCHKSCLLIRVKPEKIKEKKIIKPKIDLLPLLEDKNG